MLRKCLWCLCALLASFQFVTWAAPAGTAFTYQGRLTSGGDPVSGIYDFRFAVFDSATGGLQLGSTLSNTVPVSEGLFLAALDFGDQFRGSARWLEISVRTNAAGPYMILSPRQELTPDPYALYAPAAGTASLATSVAPGSITSGGLAAGAVMASNLAPGAVSQLGSPDGTQSNVVQVSSNGFVGIGTTNPAAGLEINGGQMMLTPVIYSEVVDGFGAYSNLAGAYGVAVSTNLVAVAAPEDNAVTLLRSDGSLSLVSTIVHGTGSFTNLLGAESVAFGTNNLLAIAAPAANAVTLVDASNPAKPVWRSVIRNGAGWSTMAGACAVAFRSNVLAVAARSANAVTLVNAANPAAPTPIVVMTNRLYGFDYLGEPRALAFRGNLLAIAAYRSNAVTLVDVSNLSNPNPIAVLSYNTGFPDIIGPWALALDGNLLAVASISPDAVILVDVSKPAAPVQRSVLQGYSGPFYFSDPWGLVFLHRNGRTLLAFTAQGSSSMTIVDVTDPGQPVVKGQFRNEIQPGLHHLALPTGLAVNALGQLVAADNIDPSGLVLLGLGDTKAGLVSDTWVGIGTTTPMAPLDVQGDVLVEYASRFKVRAFRFELGENAEASGDYAMAMGFGTTAAGSCSMALGCSTTAKGVYSTAMGYGTMASGDYSTALGGRTIAGGSYSLAAGYRAQATNNNCFVWADGSGNSFGSTAPNQFLIRAAGGVGIGTTHPLAALDIRDSTNVETGHLHIGGTSMTGEPKLIQFGDGDYVHIGENGYDDLLELKADTFFSTARASGSTLISQRKRSMWWAISWLPGRLLRIPIAMPKPISHR